MNNRFSRIVEDWWKEDHLPDGTTRYSDGSSITYVNKNGYHHRTDGPAFINKRSGIIEYWIDGRKLSKEEFEKHFEIKNEE